MRSNHYAGNREHLQTHRLTTKHTSAFVAAVVMTTAMLFAALTAGCQPAEQRAPSSIEKPETPKDGGTVVRGNFVDAQMLNPFLITNNASRTVVGAIFEGLTTTHPQTGAPVPELAESWDISPDGLTYTFKLRRDVKWHDGQPFTAADVKFTYETIMDPQTKSVRKSLYEKVRGAKARADGSSTEIEGIKLLDQHTVRIELVESFCPFLISSASMGIVPKHLLQTSKDINADEFNTKSPIGTGPFRFKEWVKGDHIALTKNEHYWKGRPRLDQLVFKVVPNITAVAAQLKTGEIDIGTVEASSLAEMERTEGISVHKLPRIGYTYMMHNIARPFFQEQRVRQALTHAIDRQKFIDSILFNQAEVQHANTSAASWAYNGDIPKLAYDPERARRLLAEAGYTTGTDSMIRDSSGQAVKLTLFTNSGDNVNEHFVTVAKEQLKAVGVEVELRMEETTALIARLNRKDFDMAVYSVSFEADPDAKSIWYTKEALNRASYSHQEVDKLLDEGRALPGCDQGKRKEIYGKIDRLLATDQPYTFLFSQKTMLAVNNKVKDLKPSPWFPFGAQNIHELWRKD